MLPRQVTWEELSELITWWARHTSAKPRTGVQTALRSLWEGLRGATDAPPTEPLDLEGHSADVFQAIRMEGAGGSSRSLLGGRASAKAKGTPLSSFRFYVTPKQPMADLPLPASVLPVARLQEAGCQLKDIAAVGWWAKLDGPTWARHLATLPGLASDAGLAAKVLEALAKLALSMVSVPSDHSCRS
jgi:hypothetical protein